MPKPKTRGQRRGGRNAQFFEGLSGLARGLDAAIERNRPVAETPHDDLGAQEQAEAKRKRKAYARLRQAGLLKHPTTDKRSD